MFLEKFIRISSRYLHDAVQPWYELLPSLCVLCSDITRKSRNLCADCQKDLPILSYSCLRCAQILPESSSLWICGGCQKQSPPFDRTYSLFLYRPPIVRLIIDLKFHQQLCYAKLFSELLVEKIQQDWYCKKNLPDVILPMPLHPLRLKERGFNQALEIARPIAKALTIPIDLYGATRKKPTVPQSHLPAVKREQNISNAFQINRDYRNQHIAILDDVITTGYTVRELCQGLKMYGAKQIDVWCCARSVND